MFENKFLITLLFEKRHVGLNMPQNNQPYGILRCGLYSAVRRSEAGLNPPPSRGISFCCKLQFYRVLTRRENAAVSVDVICCVWQNRIDFCVLYFVVWRDGAAWIDWLSLSFKSLFCRECVSCRRFRWGFGNEAWRQADGRGGARRCREPSTQEDSWRAACRWEGRSRRMKGNVGGTGEAGEKGWNNNLIIYILIC